MVVRDIILVVAVLGVMVFGFFIMKRLANSLTRTENALNKKKRKKSRPALCLPPI